MKVGKPSADIRGGGGRAPRLIPRIVKFNNGEGGCSILCWTCHKCSQGNVRGKCVRSNVAGKCNKGNVRGECIRGDVRSRSVRSHGRSDVRGKCVKHILL